MSAARRPPSPPDAHKWKRCVRVLRPFVEEERRIYGHILGWDSATTGELLSVLETFGVYPTDTQFAELFAGAALKEPPHE